jgi:hypothetical protein
VTRSGVWVSVRLPASAAGETQPRRRSPGDLKAVIKRKHDGVGAHRDFDVGGGSSCGPHGALVAGKAEASVDSETVAPTADPMTVPGGGGRALLVVILGRTAQIAAKRLGASDLAQQIRVLMLEFLLVGIERCLQSEIGCVANYRAQNVQ